MRLRCQESGFGCCPNASYVKHVRHRTLQRTLEYRRIWGAASRASSSDWLTSLWKTQNHCSQKGLSERTFWEVPTNHSREEIMKTWTCAGNNIHHCRLEMRCAPYAGEEA